MLVKNIISKTILFIAIVASISVFKALFGNENILVGVTGITAALVLLSEDYTLNPIKNTIKFVLLEIILGVASFIASLNPISGLIITFCIIFYLLYSLTYDTKQPIHVAFVLGYLFMLYSPVSIERLGLRISGLIFSGIMIMVVQMLTNKNRYTKETKVKIINSIKDIKYEIDLILNKEEYSKIEENNKEIHNNIKVISEYIYQYREKSCDISDEGKIKLSIILFLESINTTLKKINNDPICSNNYDYNNILINLKEKLDYISRFINKEIDSKELRISLDEFIDSDENIYYEYFLYYEIKENVSILRDIFIGLEENDLTYYDEKFSIPEQIMRKSILMNNFNKDSLKFSYAFRAAFTISLGVFIVSYFNISSGKWLIFTLYSVILPYLESSRIKSVDRLIGTIIGLIIFEIVFSIVKEDSLRGIVILAVGYLSNYPQTYRTKMIFTTISALGAASIGSNIDELIARRLGFVLLGVIIASIVNRIILPYRMKDVTNQTICKSVARNKELLEEIYRYSVNNLNEYKVRSLIVLNKMENEKVNINNNTIQSKKIESFLDNQRIMLNNVYFLFNNIRKKNLVSIDIQYTFNKINMFINGEISELEIDNEFKRLKYSNDRLVFIDIYEICDNLKIATEQSRAILDKN
ncbi:FUSC family protein [Romboutsia weinsteinii]|uniref:FUSC family protein n=1 Tax=Romboutsia weinsteinii TaxID=2020949 RepID=A0A371IZ07_9FIRM|nr:FUSC family protein [Romboutsia weinsteinii]RDY25709.1 FUSC family protein [Romboutsia weinsteinii]